jgi:hypothetical protein
MSEVCLQLEENTDQRHFVQSEAFPVSAALESLVQLGERGWDLRPS